MKKITVATLVLGALGIVIPAPRARAQVSVSVSIGTFYDELSPYGEWVDCTYGECWVPRGVGAGWQPYTNGQWIYTRYGWTWVSSDPWGGNPYHYGTWTFVSRYGWVWVPGTVWAPAWVTWSYSDSYVGWAPMPPTVLFGSAGYSGRPVVVKQAQYVFVPTNRFLGTNVRSVRVEARRNSEIFRQAKPVTRFDVSGGVVRNVALPMAVVQRGMGSKIETREISTANTAPRPVSSGGVARSAHVAIVAPARDVKAARAAWKASSPATQTQQQPKVEQRQAQPQRQPLHQPSKLQQPQPVQPQPVQPQQVQPQHQPPPQQQAKQRQEAEQPQYQREAKQHQEQQAQPQHQPPPQKQEPKVQPAQHQPPPQKQDHEKARRAVEEHGKDKDKKD